MLLHRTIALHHSRYRPPPNCSWMLPRSLNTAWESSNFKKNAVVSKGQTDSRSMSCAWNRYTLNNNRQDHIWKTEQRFQAVMSYAISWATPCFFRLFSGDTQNVSIIFACGFVTYQSWTFEILRSKGPIYSLHMWQKEKATWDAQ